MNFDENNKEAWSFFTTVTVKISSSGQKIPKTHTLLPNLGGRDEFWRFWELKSSGSCKLQALLGVLLKKIFTCKIVKM